MTKPIWEALVAGAKYSHDRLMEIWDDVRPDVVCTDNVTGYPAVELAGVPGCGSCPRTRSRCATPTYPRRCRVFRSPTVASGRRSSTSTTVSTRTC